MLSRQQYLHLQCNTGYNDSGSKSATRLGMLHAALERSMLEDFTPIPLAPGRKGLLASRAGAKALRFAPTLPSISTAVLCPEAFAGTPS
jgi:hypothetical protein